jgi:predicted Fe-Mo cluster-binding NifX family protein
MTEQSEQNNLANNGEHEEEEGLDMVKPSELNAILSRENGSRHISMLKAATIAILLLSTILSAF